MRDINCKRSYLSLSSNNHDQRADLSTGAFVHVCQTAGVARTGRNILSARGFTLQRAAVKRLRCKLQLVSVDVSVSVALRHSALERTAQALRKVAARTAECIGSQLLMSSLPGG